MKLLLVSHGNLAKEMFNVLRMITGKSDDVDYLTLPYGVDLNKYKNDIIAHVDGSDELLILCDLFGGSPFMISSGLLGNDECKNKIAIITGMNLPMVLEIATQMPGKTLEEMRSLAVDIGKEGIVDLQKMIGQGG